MPRGKLARRLANEGRLPLKIAKIKVGAYLGEDDITLFADDSESNRST